MLWTRQLSNASKTTSNFFSHLSPKTDFFSSENARVLKHPASAMPFRGRKSEQRPVRTPDRCKKKKMEEKEDEQQLQSPASGQSQGGLSAHPDLAELTPQRNTNTSALHLTWFWNICYNMSHSTAFSLYQK